MSIIERLLVVQDHDCKIRQMNQEKHDIPARKELEKKRLEEHRVALAESEEQLKAKQSDVKQLELDIESHREKISKLRTQQVDIKTNKEFRALEDEVKALETKIAGVEERELQLMEVVEEARQGVDAKKAALQEEDNDVKADIEKLDQRLAGIEDRLTKETSLRDEASVGIDPEWLERYQRIIERKDLAIVKLENGICGGCHMKVPPQIMHNAKKQLEMVSCDMCGRILY